MAEDTLSKAKVQASRIALQVVSKLSMLQDVLNKHGLEDSSQHIKEIGTMQRYLLTHFNESKTISMELGSEAEIDYLVLCAESDADTIYQGTLPDRRIFKLRVSGGGSRTLTLFSFSKWMDNGMKDIANRVFKDRKWAAERPLLRDSDIMHFIEEA